MYVEDDEEMNQALNNFDLDKLNSLTKYPSILTYHELGDKGVLKESLSENKGFGAERTEYSVDENIVYITEKIDGTNGRIIIYKNDYMIGSREDILYAKDDRIVNSALGIVSSLRFYADHCLEKTNSFDRYQEYFYDIVVLYFEVYGGNVTKNSKQYTNAKKWGEKLIDICFISANRIKKLMDFSREKISLWREHGGQIFFTEDDINNFSCAYNISRVPLLKTIREEDMPITLSATYDFLQQFSKSEAVLDGGSGNAEGIVIRNYDRGLIRKIRFEDYERGHRKGGF